MKKSLIIALDDSRTNLEILKSTLCNEHDIICTHSTQEFYTQLKYLHPDLLLIDVILGEVSNGFEVCKNMKMNYDLADIPVIFLTSLEDSVNEEAGFLAGGVDYIKKPFVASVLKARINTHLELKHSRDTLFKLANHDGLTGALNKQVFHNNLKIAWLKGLRTKEPLSIIMIDIDFFKKYNDHYGHIQGDECLKQVSYLIQQALVPQYELYRMGGEEFAILLPHSDDSAVFDIANKIQQKIIDGNISHEQSTIAPHVTLSMGTSTGIAQSKWLPELLLKKADEALYDAKNSGRNKIKSMNLE